MKSQAATLVIMVPVGFVLGHSDQFAGRYDSGLLRVFLFLFLSERPVGINFDRTGTKGSANICSITALWFRPDRSRNGQRLSGILLERFS